jgi:hypothetical protein
VRGRWRGYAAASTRCTVETPQPSVLAIFSLPTLPAASSRMRASSSAVTPRIVHAALGTQSEEELQQYLDDCDVSDYYGDDGEHLGPDDSGLEMFRD